MASLQRTKILRKIYPVFLYYNYIYSNLHFHQFTAILKFVIRSTCTSSPSLFLLHILTKNFLFLIRIMRSMIVLLVLDINSKRPQGDPIYRR